MGEKKVSVDAVAVKSIELNTRVTLVDSNRDHKKYVVVEENLEQPLHKNQVRIRPVGGEYTGKTKTVRQRDEFNADIVSRRTVKISSLRSKHLGYGGDWTRRRRMGSSVDAVEMITGVCATPIDEYAEEALDKKKINTSKPPLRGDGVDHSTGRFGKIYVTEDTAVFCYYKGGKDKTSHQYSIVGTTLNDFLIQLEGDSESPVCQVSFESNADTCDPSQLHQDQNSKLKLLFEELKYGFQTASQKKDAFEAPVRTLETVVRDGIPNTPKRRRRLANQRLIDRFIRESERCIRS